MFHLAFSNVIHVEFTKAFSFNTITILAHIPLPPYSTSKMVPLSSRCNSLTFTEIHSIRSRFLAIAESEKALLKADIEADVKYKQLIHEAETILVSMKTTALR